MLDKSGFDSSSGRYYNKTELEECCMAIKKFTEEDMNHLRASPYVLDVSPSIVHFSAEFKELFWNSIQEGKEP